MNPPLKRDHDLHYAFCMTRMTPPIDPLRQPVWLPRDPMCSPADPNGSPTTTVEHELRNALMPLLLHLDLLDLRASSAATGDQTRLAAIVENVQRLANGLLLRARTHSARESLETVRLQRWWSEVGELIRSPLPATCMLAVRLPKSLPAVRIEPGVFAQVLLHLMVSVRLSLAADGPYQVEITGRRTAHGVTLSIRDGLGLARHARPSTQSEVAQHWGLSLSNTLLKYSGAELSGYSNAGRGTHVMLHLLGATELLGTLPHDEPEERASTAGPPAMELPYASSLKHETATLAAAPMRVLIIDDNIALTSALALRLALETDIDCLPPIHELRDSVAQVLMSAPSIVLLDLNLPGNERPIDVIRGLRERGSPARVVVLTGNPSLDAATETRNAGAAGFIAKGLSPETLIASLHRVARGEYVLEL